MSLFSTFFKKEEPRALGIDIGSSAIKIVQIKRKNGQAILETYGELALGPYGGVGIGQAVQLPTDKIAAALGDLMKEKEVNVTTKKCGISIPFSSSLMSVIEMPEVGSKQLSVMVPLEARRYIPVPINEVILDWSVIPKNDPEQTPLVPQDFGETSIGPSQTKISKIDVLVVAIHKETISRYQDIVTSSGLEAGFFEIEIFSTMRSVLDATLQPVLVMDMGAASTKIYIVERGLIRVSHTINRGAQDITSTLSKSLSISLEEAEIKKRGAGLTGNDKNVTEIITLVLDYIFAEVNTSILAFEEKYNKAVYKTLLVGGGASLKGIRDLAKSNLKTEVELGLPFNKVLAPAFLDNILRETGPEFAVAVGLALRKLAESQV
ncbi:MAG: type IV pilus assembly protein PilM [Candidatus Zambryskibacteria bacterium]|nr:type IV pilus assembly protein PilM [Candidatus Zambryskibacteria bacterium]